MAAETREAGFRAEHPALGRIGRIHLYRDPHITFEHLSGPHVQAMDRSPEYFRRATTVADGGHARASACERAYFCEAALPDVHPGGMAAALGVVRTLPRISRDAARAETSFLRVFDVR